MSTNRTSSFQSSPAAFVDRLLIDGARGVGVIKQDGWQRRDGTVIDGALLRLTGAGVGPGVNRVGLMRPRGHSKTLDAAARVLWLLLYSQREIRALSVAGDRDQARLLIDAMGRLVRLNKLDGIVDVTLDAVANRKTGSAIETISGNSLGSYGSDPHLIVADEWVHWPYQSLWDSVLTSAGKRPDCVLVLLSNAGTKRTWQERAWKRLETDPAWYCAQLPGPSASWIPASAIEEQRRNLETVVFDRLVANQWVDGTGAEAIPAVDIDRAAVLGGPCGPEPGWHYVAGLDVGVRSHATGFAIVGRLMAVRKKAAAPRVLSLIDRARIDLGMMDQPEPADEWEPYTGPPRFKLASVRAWHPTPGNEVDLAAVGRAIMDADRQYGLRQLLADPYEAEWLRQQLRRAGVPMHELRFTPSAMTAVANCLVETFGSGSIEIPNDPQLLADLRALRIAETPGGWKLDPPRTASGHGDRAIAAALAIYAAVRHSEPYVSRKQMQFAGQFLADDLYHESRGSFESRAFT